MNNLERLYIDSINTIYGINNNMVIIPNNLNENINVYLAFNNNLNIDNNDLLDSIKSYKNDIDVNDSNSMLFIYNVNSTDFYTNLTNIKKLVNNIYNVMLKSNKYTKKSFIRNIKLINDSNNIALINWLTSNQSKKFSLVDRHGIAITKNNINNLQDSINRGSNINFNTSSDSLSIGSVPVQYHVNNTKPNNQTFSINSNSGFIKWTGIIGILIMSLVVGIFVSLYLLK